VFVIQSDQDGYLRTCERQIEDAYAVPRALPLGSIEGEKTLMIEDQTLRKGVIFLFLYLPNLEPLAPGRLDPEK